MQKVKAYLQIARPHQYLKNVFVFAPLFFGYKQHDLQAMFQTFYTFFAFCLVSSSIYVLNDLADETEDRHHPVKKFRPLARGALNRSEALVFFILLLSLTTLFSAILLSNKILIIIGAYFLINVVYSYFLKHLPIIDVVCVAVGFVLRIFAGGIAADVPVSHWLVLMTFLLALFIALAKRRDDLQVATNQPNVRRSKAGYNLEFISTSMVVMASVIIVSYILYTVSPEIITKHGTNQLYLTSFWVIVGILRYMQITFVEERSGDPTRVFLKDYYLQVVVILWVLSFYLLLYLLKN
jgi:4-hydroxybenzoate polyprenyltransferase